MISAFLIIGLVLGEAPSAAELEAVAARRAIRSAVIEVLSTNFDATGIPKSQINYKLWLSGDNRRQDLERPLVVKAVPKEEPAPKEGKKPGIKRGSEDLKRDLKCYSGGDFIEWIEFNKPGLTTPLIIRRAGAGKEDLAPLDPRWLGMAPITVGNLVAHGAIDALVGNPKRANVSEVEDTWEGKPAVRVRFERGKATIEVWIVPEWGHSVVRISEADDKTEWWIENKVALDAPSKLWFPVRCVHGTTVGMVRTVEQESVITVKSLNAPVDLGIFQLSTKTPRPTGSSVSTPR